MMTTQRSVMRYGSEPCENAKQATLPMMSATGRNSKILLANNNPCRYGRYFWSRSRRNSSVVRASTSRSSGRMAPDTSDSNGDVAKSLEHPVCIVTGGSRGIGKAILMQLAKEKCRVVVFDLAASAETGLTTISEAKEAGADDILFVGGNVADQHDVNTLFEQVQEKWGRVDVLVNNAGITRDGLMMRMKPQQWAQVIDVNLNGTFYCTQAATKVMSKQRRGRVINISSVVGVHGNAGQANYAASKAAIIGLTKSSAQEFASRGITVNAIAPGFIESAMTDVLTDDQQSKILTNIPLGRMGTPDEVAGVVRFLALDPAAKYISGQVIVVDGGMTM